MEVVRQIEGNINDFFDRVEESLLADIKTSTGNSININEIVSGFTYFKELTSQLGKRGKVKVIINECTRPIKYSVSFISIQGENTLSYEAKPIDENKFELIYSENFKGSSKANSWNYKVMSKLYKRSSIKKANLVLNNIELMIQK